VAGQGSLGSNGLCRGAFMIMCYLDVVVAVLSARWAKKEFGRLWEEGSVLLLLLLLWGVK
jgi:hypothetical protein